MSDLDELFGSDPEQQGEALPASEPVVATPETAEAAPVIEQAPPSAEPASPPPAPDPAPVIDEVMGRVAAVMAEREKRQGAERERDELRKQIDAIRQREAAAEAKRTPIDPLTDPDAYRADVARQIGEAEARAVQRASAMWSVNVHGEEATRAAEAAINDAVKTSTALAEELARQPNPYDFAVKWHQRQKLLADIGNDPDAFVRRRAAELGLIAPASASPHVAAAAPVPLPSTQPPPRSLASAPAAGAGAGLAPDQFDKRLFG